MSRTTTRGKRSLEPKPIERLARSADGYAYFHDQNHPLASANGQVFMHRVVASFALGRWLQDGEIVTFLDGNVTNLHPTNLEVIDRAELGRRTRGREYLQLRRFDLEYLDLYQRVWKKPTEQVGADLGVSGKAVEKRCRKMGIPKPPRGYWAKIQHGYCHEDALKQLHWTPTRIQQLNEVLETA
jgi:hypothetical protein